MLASADVTHEVASIYILLSDMRNDCVCMFGNNAKAFYGYELTSLYGRSLAPVRFQCEQTIGKIDSNATLEEFLKKICYD